MLLLFLLSIVGWGDGTVVVFDAPSSNVQLDDFTRNSPQLFRYSSFLSLEWKNDDILCDLFNFEQWKTASQIQIRKRKSQIGRNDDQNERILQWIIDQLERNPNGDVLDSNSIAGYLLGQGLNAHRFGDVEEALVLFRVVLSLDVNSRIFVDALHFCGQILQLSHQLERACLFLTAARHYDANTLDIRVNLGLNWIARGQSVVGKQVLQEAAVDLAFSKQHPISIEAKTSLFLALGTAMSSTGDDEGALQAFRICLREVGDVQSISNVNLRNSVEMCQINAATLLEKKGRYIEAFSLLQQGIRVDLIQNEKKDEAIAQIAKLVAECVLIGQEDVSREWLVNVTQAQLNRGGPSLHSTVVFSALFLPLPTSLQLQVMKFLSKKADIDHSLKFTTFALLPSRIKISVAYVSSDFGNTVMLSFFRVALGSHNKNKFRTILHSLKYHDNSVWRQEVADSVDEFVQWEDSKKSHEIAKMMNDQQIDVAVHLDGHNVDSNIQIFAYHPARVQVAYRFCSSVGADYIEHYLVDRVVAPPELTSILWSEHLVYLPGQYLVNNIKKYHYEYETYPTLEQRLAVRKELGLDANKFVFASFNRFAKLDRITLVTWMHILTRRADSLLWILKFPADGVSRIKKMAVKHGVDPSRIIATQVAKEEEFLRRVGCADLVLDTPRCNAHTTATYSLWQGTPLLTLSQQRATSRVAASLMTAAGVSQLLVARDYADYEEIAVRFPRNMRIEMRDSVLFDYSKWVRDWEVAMSMLIQIPPPQQQQQQKLHHVIVKQN